MASNEETPCETQYADCMDDDDEDDDEDEDEAWDEMDAESENHITCLFCTQNFKTMAVALEHCKTEHNFNLTQLKTRFQMDCYSYICMINYIRREGVGPQSVTSCENDPPWLSGNYLAPVIPDDPWLMFDFEGLESPLESRAMTPERDFHVVNAENGLVTLSEQHFAQLQYIIKCLTAQVEEKDEALSMAADQIQQMKLVTQKLVASDLASENQELEKNISNLKLSEDHGYFNTYSHFGIHHEMLSDKVRTSSYRDAILNNGSSISNKIVMDVGCGTSILSMFSVAAGAARVFAIDQSEIIFHAMDIVRENSMADKIDLIHGRIESISLPVEKVDVIISEWMGYFLLFEGMLDSILWARDRYLKPDGILVPNRCSIYLVGLSDPESYQQILGFWSDVYGFKMTCLAKEVIREAIVSEVSSSKIATSSATVLDLNLYTANVDSTNFSSDFIIESVIDGNVTALCGYFDTFFDLTNPVILSTSPCLSSTHWKQTVFYLPKPIAVKVGETIKGQITCRRNKDDNRALVISITVNGQKNTYMMS